MRSGSETVQLLEALSTDITRIAQQRPPSGAGAFGVCPGLCALPGRRALTYFFFLFFKESFAACSEASNRVVNLKKWEYMCVCIYILVGLFNMSGFTSPSQKPASHPNGLWGVGQDQSEDPHAVRPCPWLPRLSHGESVFRALPC